MLSAGASVPGPWSVARNASSLCCPQSYKPKSCLHRTLPRTWGWREGLGVTPAQVMFCFSDVLPRKGQSSKYVELSCQLFLAASLVVIQPGGGFRWN